MTLQRFSSDKKSSRFDFGQSFKRLILPCISLVLMMIYNIFWVYDYFISQSYDGLDVSKGVNFFGSMVSKTYTTFNFNESTTISQFILGIVICGFLFALFSFLPFTKKNCVNFYHSSPVTRNDLFKNRIISSVILMAGILFVGVAVITSFNLIVIDDTSFIIKFAIAYFAECFVYLLVSFSISCLAFSLANTFIEGTILSGGLLALPTLAVFGFDNFCQVFLKGYSKSSVLGTIMTGDSFDYFTDISLLHKTSLFNPFLFGANMKTHSIRESIIASTNYEQYDVEGIGTQYKFLLPTPSQYTPIIIWAIVSVAVLFIAGYVFNKRRVENAGIHASNKHINLFVALEFAFCFSSILVTVFDKEYSTPIMILIAIASFILAFAVFYSISIRKIKHSKKAITFATATTLCLSLFIGIVSTGGLGYSYRVPSPDNIKMVTVSGTGVSADGAEVNWVKGSKNICSLNRNNAMGIFAQKESINKFVDIANHFDDKTENMIDAPISIVYQLNNGKKVYRNYETLDKKVLIAFLELVDTREYEKVLYDVLVNGYSKELSENAEALGINEDMYFSDYLVSTCSKYYDTAKAFITKTGSETVEIKNTKALRKAIAEDYINATYDELYFSNKMPVCSIGFTVEDYIDYNEYYDGKVVDVDTNTLSLNTFYILPTMKNTIDYLNSVGAINKAQEYDAFKSIDCIYVDSIENISNKSFFNKGIGIFAEGCYSCDYSDELDDSYNSENIFDCKNNPHNKITDKAEIKKLLSNATTFRYATPDDMLMLVQGTNQHGELICVQLIKTNN